MMQKVLNPLIFRNFSFLLTSLLFCQYGMSQSLSVGPNAEFYLPANAVFTTSNTVINVDASGMFSVEAGSNWGSSQEYVNGPVTAYGTGETLLPTGDNGVYAPIIADHTGNVSGTYYNESPMVGTNGVNVDAVGDVEYWKMSGSARVTLPWNENSEITSLVNDNGGSLNSVAIVGYDNGSGIWNLISGSQTNVVSGDLLNGDVTSDALNMVDLSVFEQLTFGIDHQIVLAANDLFLTNGISLVSNPVRAEETNIQFTASNEMIDLNAAIYDINGRLMKTFDKVDVTTGIGNLSKTNLKSGLYFIKFEYEGKQGTKKIIIE